MLLGDFLAIFGDFLAIFWRFFGDFLAIFWRFLAIFWRFFNPLGRFFHKNVWSPWHSPMVAAAEATRFAYKFYLRTCMCADNFKPY
jgi:hypothetical protein